MISFSETFEQVAKLVKLHLDQVIKNSISSEYLPSYLPVCLTTDQPAYISAYLSAGTFTYKPTHTPSPCPL